MKRNYLVKAFAMLVASASLVSCIEDSDELSANGDAFVVVQKVGQDTLMGLGLHAFSWVEFTSVTVAPPDNSALRYNLAAYQGYKQDFYWETPITEYDSDLPLAGDYLFSAVFTDGQTLAFSDKLAAGYLNPPLIKSCVYENGTGQVKVEWGSLANAQSYNVKLIDAEGIIRFVSPEYNSATTDYAFSKNTQGWQSTEYPASGDVVTIEVAAYLKENGPSDANLQCISKAGKVITWGN